MPTPLLVAVREPAPLPACPRPSPAVVMACCSTWAARTPLAGSPLVGCCGRWAGDRASCCTSTS
ncbi:hypothetical protein V2I01_31580 [Micromonospora sp. BRA006-A]|nr:hypothetical protein [Micromonospora sp. BRA006-A]